MAAAASATVKTVQYVDPRIEPQPDPVYDYVIGPTQNQFYKIPASGLSNSSITFNNLTTLGVDRAYLDTFEIELQVEIDFHIDNGGDPLDLDIFKPLADEWTFQSFPFNTVCDEARVNINGGAFFSQPMSYIRAKERYMNQYELSKCYENVCPIHKPLCQTESGRNYHTAYTRDVAQTYNNPAFVVDTTYNPETGVNGGWGVPTRLGAGMFNTMQSDQGMYGGFNNSIVRLGKQRTETDKVFGWTNYYRERRGESDEHLIVIVTWREPLFVSPFSSRYDATYGRPLYNITSMDLTFNLMDLGNMIRVVNLHNVTTTTQEPFVDNYNIAIKKAQLCYQVMTIPSTIKKPLTTLVPYRRFVPYLTDFNQTYNGAGTGGAVNNIPIEGSADDITVTSGVYTLNEIPTAIWIFAAPIKSRYQMNQPDVYSTVEGSDMTKFVPEDEDNVNAMGNWDSNKLFAYLRKVNITMANTTQILNTAETYDLYRIAKANGCEDSYLSWAIDDAMLPKFITYGNPEAASQVRKSQQPLSMYSGAGSVLRLKPGVDLIVPDIPLIPGANANNMVLQVHATFKIPPHSLNQSQYALWLLFEYVGVAAISPGQCEITMNPLGSGEIMAVSPVMSATSDATEGKLEGSGFWDGVKKATRITGQIADDGVLSKILRRIPGAEKAAAWAASHGLGEPGMKRPRGGATNGGAVIGRGLNEWV